MFRYGCLAAVLLAGLTGPSFAQQSQPATPAYPTDAVINGDDVYVRSGPGSNYYPTTKLHSGDAVRVIGEQFGWARIAPPTGSFSYVDMSMVDKTGDKQGKVKVENLRVYAGSTLSSHKNEMQTVLPKDAIVQIVGEADGFYKIIPPSESVLWVSGQFVSRPGQKTPLIQQAAMPTRSKPTPTGAASGAPSSRPTTAADTGIVTHNNRPNLQDALPSAPDRQPTRTTHHTEMTETPASRPSETVTLHPTSAIPERWKPFMKGGEPAERLSAAEKELRETLSKPNFTRQQLEALLQQYEQIAAQSDDAVAAALARSRKEQLKPRIEILATRDRLAQEQKDLALYRQQLGMERQDILRRAADAEKSVVTFKGELRTSMLFPTSMGRYRLADPADTQTTVAYIDIPAELRDEASQYLGQVVIVKAPSQTFNQDLRTPVAVISDIQPARPKARVAASQPAAGNNSVATDKDKDEEEDADQPDKSDEKPEAQKSGSK